MTPTRLRQAQRTKVNIFEVNFAYTPSILIPASIQQQQRVSLGKKTWNLHFCVHLLRNKVVLP